MRLTYHRRAASLSSGAALLYAVTGYKLSEEINEEGMTATLRGATALWLLQTRGRITTKELADELSMKVRGARYLMDNLSLSRRFPITKEGIYWRLMR